MRTVRRALYPSRTGGARVMRTVSTSPMRVGTSSAVEVCVVLSNMGRGPASTVAIGDQFGKLTVVGEGTWGECRGKRYRRSVCQCACGGSITVQNTNLTGGNTRSCGCLRVVAVGDVYGQLTVVSEASRGNRGEKRFLCRCKCDNLTTAGNSKLRDGSVKSCGCLVKLAFGQASENAVLTSLKQSAKLRNIQWKLSDAEVRLLIRQPCHWCGRANVNTKRSRRSNGDFQYNGLDRIDNAHGYSSDNVWTCCGACNRMRGTLTPEAFEAHIRLIADTRRD